MDIQPLFITFRKDMLHWVMSLEVPAIAADNQRQILPVCRLVFLFVQQRGFGPVCFF
jgi:hypothetical protein